MWLMFMIHVGKYTIIHYMDPMGKVVIGSQPPFWMRSHNPILSGLKFTIVAKTTY